uniref:uncharacterized protein LOC105351978 n=1 Tax=Fragaria vesca subsp. vesca TaxID=101020 RepID=UPI0005C94357|nr:PREDICTED: uncharacterized protein LOC105351978 [Fragaria vesca subsp. vesca]XP_011465987.1 PREDICTED: uncharacterized protein LOC105351978 [Fragaria vesca subsp. vesca]
MEEMKNPTEAVLEKKGNDVVGESTEKRALVEFICFSRRYPKRIESKLQRDLDMVKSTLEDYGINYHMNLVVCAIALYTTRTRDADLIEKARVLVRLFALDVPASQAITILKGRNWEVMKLGYGIKKMGLICSQDGSNEFLEYCINSTREFDAGLNSSMEEMKNLTEAVEKKRNDDIVCESTMNFGHSLMDEDEDSVNFELVTLSRRYPKCIESRLQEYLPTVNSTLEDYGIVYQMNLVTRTITLSTKRTRDADLIEKAKDILRLLTLAVFAPVAISILKGRDWEVMRLGYQKDGLCSQFGINKEKYYERLKLLGDHAIKDIAVMLYCNLQIFGDILVVVGSASSIKSMLILAKDCIVHGIHPASRVKSVKDAEARHQTMKRLEGLDLNDYCLARDRSKREIKRPIRFQQK